MACGVQVFFCGCIDEEGGEPRINADGSDRWTYNEDGSRRDAETQRRRGAKGWRISRIMDWQDNAAKTG